MSATPYPPNNDSSGWYSPAIEPYNPLPSYEDWLNSTNGILAIQDTDAIHNLVNQLPLLRQVQLQLGGEECILLRRKTSGTRCPQYNETCGGDAESKCHICFGTGWTDGYHDAIVLKASFIPGRADVQIEQAGLTITQRPTAWTINTQPIIKEFDILISYSNERYKVHSAEAVEIQGRRMYQELTLSRIDKYDVAYDVPVPAFQGQAKTKFICKVVIRSPRTNFYATVLIRNYIIYPENGLTE